MLDMFSAVAGSSVMRRLRAGIRILTSVMKNEK
jgi:hypothetical protein